jgi:hypothetical protein
METSVLFLVRHQDKPEEIVDFKQPSFRKASLGSLWLDLAYHWLFLYLQPGDRYLLVGSML